MNALKKFLLICSSALIVACGGGGDDPVAPTTVVATENTAIANIKLSPSARTLKADGKEVITWTVFALTSGNASIKGAKVDVSATNGVILGASQLTTTETGATVTMIADPTDQRNRTTTLTASCAGCSAPSATSDITVTGATLDLVSSPDANLVVGNAGATLKATLRNASGAVMSGVPLSFAVTDGLILSVSADSASTDSTGSASVTVTGLSAGSARVNVTALGAASSTLYNSAVPASAMAFTAPANKSVVITGTPTTVTVAAPGATSVVFGSTVGTFASGSVAVPVVAGSATDVLTSNQAGTATITAFDSLGRSVNRTVNFSPPVSAVNKILLNASQTTLPVSTVGVERYVTLTASAIKFDATSGQDQGVANVPITFSMSGGPGAGEYLTPAIAYTDSSGKAVARFVAGTATSITNGITIGARYGTVSTGPNSPPSSNNVQLTVGGSALSVAFGAASVLGESTDKTLYTSAYSVQVTDANNNPVANQLVTLRMRPVAFSPGVGCSFTRTYCSEDINGNGSLETGEDGARLQISNDLSDVNNCKAGGAFTPNDSLKNSILTPQNSDGGSVPSTVTTDKNGIAAFDLTYLKGSALWVVNQLTATVSSNGTETSKSTIFRLTASETDVKLPDVCHIPNSPYSN